MREKRSQLLPCVLTTIKNASIAFVSHPSRNASSIYRALRQFRQLQAISDAQLRGVTRYILDKKYLSITCVSGKVRATLTADGQQLVDRVAMHSLKPRRRATWDGKWQIVLFDIPEEYKKRRNSFAANLKAVGFTQIQKSVFAFPFSCGEEIEAMANFHNVQPFICCLLAESLDGGAELGKAYGLKPKTS